MTKKKNPPGFTLTPVEYRAVCTAAAEIADVKFVFRAKGHWWSPASDPKLRASPGRVEAYVGGKVAFFGIDDEIVELKFPGVEHDLISVPNVPGTLSAHVIRIKQTAKAGTYKYFARGRKHGEAVGDSPPKIIIYE